MGRPTALARSVKEPTAFDAFYRAHANALLRYFARRTLDPEAAADLTAETFARAYQHRGQFRGTTDQEAGGWLYTIAQRQLLAYQKRGAVEKKAMRRLGIREPELTDDEYERIEEMAELESLRGKIASALKQLPPSTRLALTLRVVEDLDYAEIAQRLDIKEPAARARVSRALRGLYEVTKDGVTS
ncbi:ECF RNA polymerase sigma factor SigE [Baekduia alba]|uniref:RNA polymerase sigma factor n=1 Tax=Baekduia alba TaxID=2997333 RepID=UPI002340DEED|nr:sigma-70 family RNA polymerase sigma factor [Baekduia alba]WCB95065.1 ECF RNA polymerase sigma factor SigE [Baekduia alba]